MWAFVDTGLVWDGRGTDLGTERYEGFAGCLNVPLFLLGRLSRIFVFLSQRRVSSFRGFAFNRGFFVLYQFSWLGLLYFSRLSLLLLTPRAITLECREVSSSSKARCVHQPCVAFLSPTCPFSYAYMQVLSQTNTETWKPTHWKILCSILKIRGRVATIHVSIIGCCIGGSFTLHLTEKTFLPTRSDFKAFSLSVNKSCGISHFQYSLYR
jgi:hypothetical protein